MMIRIAIFSDLHGNLPALDAMLEKIRTLQCSAVYSLGDAIGIGPYSDECVDAFRKNGIISVIGNHEEYLLKGIRRPLPQGMGEGEFEHHDYIHGQISPENKQYIRTWSDRLEVEIGGKRCLFIHSPCIASEPFHEYTCTAGMSAGEIEDAFSMYSADVIFFGHTHVICDMEHGRRYINPGSVGCHEEDSADFTVVEFESHDIAVRHYQIPYCKIKLMQELDERKIPDGDFIKKTFF